MLTLNSIFQKIESFAETPFWKVKTALLFMILSIFFATPSYNYMGEAFKDENWQTLQRKIEHPFTPVKDVKAVTHAAKKDFRLTVPLIAKLFHLNPYGIYLFQFVLGILSLVLILEICVKVTSDKVVAFLFAFGATFTYFGRVSFTDIYSHFDGWVYFFILSALFSSNAIGVFLFTSLAAWTDERGFIALAIVFLFHGIHSQASQKEITTKSFFNKLSLSALLSVVVYFILRLYLGWMFGLSTPKAGVGLDIMLWNIDFLGLGSWSHFEGFWLLIALYFYVLLKEQKWLLLIPSAGVVAVFTLIAYMTLDITRSGSYLFPLAFVALGYVFTKDDFRPYTRTLIFVCAAVSFIYPAYYVMTGLNPYALWVRPGYVRVLEYALQHL